MSGQQASHGTRSAFKRGCRCDACWAYTRAYSQAYYQRNKAKKIAQAKAWKHANPERARELGRERYWRDPAKAIAATIAAQRKNPELTKSRQRAFFASDKGRELMAYHRQLRRSAVTDDLTKEFIAVLLNDPCCYCGAPVAEIDHIVPVTRGGTSEHHNLTAACRSCNASKGNQDLLGFLSRRASVEAV